jgi:pSer/pThr/pTyr-binding forkhead associated (FHA) protein
MSADNQTTLPISPELDRLQRRLLISRRWLDAAPPVRSEPCLIRRARDNNDNLETCPLKGETIIGRHGDGPFRYPSEMESMSRQHFRILVATDGRCFAHVCENAKNGLHINGREVTSRRLIHGDQIYAGGEEFVFAEQTYSVLPE